MCCKYTFHVIWIVSYILLGVLPSTTGILFSIISLNTKFGEGPMPDIFRYGTYAIIIAYSLGFLLLTALLVNDCMQYTNASSFGVIQVWIYCQIIWIFAQWIYFTHPTQGFPYQFKIAWIGFIVIGYVSILIALIIPVYNYYLLQYFQKNPYQAVRSNDAEKK